MGRFEVKFGPDIDKILAGLEKLKQTEGAGAVLRRAIETYCVIEGKTQPATVGESETVAPTSQETTIC